MEHLTIEEFNRVVVHVKELDNLLWKHYFPESTAECNSEGNALVTCLENDIVYVLTKGFELNDVKTFIYNTIASDMKGVNVSALTLLINDYIDFDKCERSANVRKDLPSALKLVKKGSDLSGILNYNIFDETLSELAQLHKSNRYRKKIEELLEDCNFHQEGSDFKNKRYDKYIIGAKIPEETVLSYDETNNLIITVSSDWFKANTIMNLPVNDRDIAYDSEIFCKALNDINASNAMAYLRDNQLTECIYDIKRLQNIASKIKGAKVKVMVNPTFIHSEEQECVEIYINDDLYASLVTADEADASLRAFEKMSKVFQPAKYILETTYSFDNDSPAWIFNSKEEAITELKKQFEEEVRIDTEENGHIPGENYETEYDDDWTFAQITISFENEKDITIWRIRNLEDL